MYRVVNMTLPNGPLDIVFSFDTTDSMAPCLKEVRDRVSDMVQRLQADIPGIRCAIFAHGDYCYKTNYITKWVDFTDDVGTLCNFVKSVNSTCDWNGDYDECYELVLYQVRTRLSWQPGSQRALVMIGDASPHGPNYPGNTMHIDWRKEVDGLKDMGVRIYGVNCGKYGRGDKFFQEISATTFGHYLELSDFKHVFHLLTSVGYNEKGVDMLHMYEKEVMAGCGPAHTDLDKLFDDLRDTASTGCSTSTTAKPVHLKKKTSIPKTTRKRITLGVVKKYKPTRASVKKRETVKDSLAKYKLENLPKHHRENVSDKNFLLGDMRWSQWQLVLSPTAKDGCCQKRTGSRTGFRARKIFPGSTSKPAIYELAVQPKFRCRKFVVYCKCSRVGFHCDTVNWERKGFGRKDIADQIESVLQQGCEVHLRRALLKNIKETDGARQKLELYDYAWSVNKPERKCHRSVIKAGVEISEEMSM